MTTLTRREQLLCNVIWDLMIAIREIPDEHKSRDLLAAMYQANLILGEQK